jgi:hypothetical protein
MTEKRPSSADAIAGDATPRSTPMPWDQARGVLAAATFYWFATTRPSGAPHVRPVLGVWVDGTMYTTSNPARGKARNLAANDQVAFTVREPGVDLVLEGTAARVRDRATLDAVADAYHDKYGWPVTVEGDAYTAPYGAPTAGPPPYEPWAVTPSVVYAFGTDEEQAPHSTRFRF